MARRSSVYALPEDLRDEVCADFRSGHTGDELIARIKKAGFKISISALYRFLRTDQQIYKEHRALAVEARIWTAAIGDDPRGRVMALCENVLSVLCTEQSKRMYTEGPGAVPPAEIGILARAAPRYRTSDVSWHAPGSANQGPNRETACAKTCGCAGSR